MLLSTRFIRRRNVCLYFSQRIFAFLSLIKNGEDLAGVSVHHHSPSPCAGACGSGPRLPRSAQLADSNGQRAAGSQRSAIRASALTHVRTMCGPSFSYIISWIPFGTFRSGPPASILPRRHRAVPTGRGSRRCSCPVDTLPKRHGRPASRRLPTRPQRGLEPRERSFPGFLGHPGPRDSSRSRGTTSPKKFCAEGPPPPEPVGRRACWGS